MRSAQDVESPPKRSSGIPAKSVLTASKLVKDGLYFVYSPQEDSLRSTLERETTELTVYQDKINKPCSGVRDVMDTEFYK